MEYITISGTIVRQATDSGHDVDQFQTLLRTSEA